MGHVLCALAAILAPALLSAQEGDRKGVERGEEGKSVPTEEGNLAVLVRLNRAMLEISKNMRRSVMRLEVHHPVEAGELPAGSYRISHATATMMHQDILVTVAEAVAGAESIAGFTEGESHPVRLRLLGSHGGVAVLTGWFEHLPPDLVPAPLGPARNLPSGSLAFLVGAGDFGRESVALPGALFNMPVLRGRSGEGKKPLERVLGLKGVHCSQQDQGGVVCDSRMRLIGILRGRPSPRLTIRPLKPASREMAREQRRHQLRSLRVFLASRNFHTLLPAGEVMGAVNRVLAEREGNGAPPRPPSLGITCLDTEEGILVLRVYFGSPAHQAGMKRGDRLTHWAGSPVYKVETLKKLFHQGYSPGRLLELGVERKGKKVLVQVRFPKK